MDHPAHLLQYLVSDDDCLAEALRSALSDAEQRLDTLFDFAPEAVVLLDVDTGQFIDANPMAEQLFGFSRRALLELGPFTLSPVRQPDGLSSECGKIKVNEAVNGGAPVFEWWHCNAHGERFPCEVRLVRMPWGNRDVLRGSIVDVSGRKLLELSETGRRGILECISRGAALSETLESLVSTVERLLPGMICSVLLLDHEANCLRIGAAPSLPDFYNNAVDGIEIGPTIGSCGAAAFTGRRIVVTDILKHPNWAKYRQLSKRLQLKACWSEPIVSLSGRVLGTFAMYYAETSEPSPVELRAIEAAAHMAATVIEDEQARRSRQETRRILERRVAEETRHLTEANRKLVLAEQEARLAAVAFDTIDSIVITEVSGKILRVNESFTRLTGYSFEEVVGKTPRILKSGQHSEEFYREMWGALALKGYWSGEVWNKRKDGVIYPQWLTIACVKNVTGEITHYVGSGRDLTQQKQNERNVAAIHAARAVQQSLLPSKAPRIAGLDIAGEVRLAEQASGDFFDYVSLGKTSIGIIVADVSGHGLGPALLMAQMQGYIRALSHECDDPAKIVSHANRLFSSNTDGHFVTLFMARFDVEKRTLDCAGAGHQGYLFHANREPIILESTGLPLGVAMDSTVSSAPAITIEPGDIILLPTDGIEESHGQDDKLFGRQRMFDVVRSNATESAAQIAEALFSEAREFSLGCPQEDDMTVVVVKVLEDWQ